MACTHDTLTTLQNSMDIDDVFLSDPNGRQFKIGDLLEWSYALSLRPIITQLAKKYCFGCQYDHPSQIEHDVCIYKSYSEQVSDYLDEALALVDEDAVLGHWIGNLGSLSPTVRYHEVSRYFDPTFRRDEWKNTEWKHSIK